MYCILDWLFTAGEPTVIPTSEYVVILHIFWRFLFSRHAKWLLSHHFSSYWHGTPCQYNRRRQQPVTKLCLWEKLMISGCTSMFIISSSVTIPIFVIIVTIVVKTADTVGDKGALKGIAVWSKTNGRKSHVGCLMASLKSPLDYLRADIHLRMLIIANLKVGIKSGSLRSDVWPIEDKTGIPRFWLHSFWKEHPQNTQKKK